MVRVKHNGRKGAGNRSRPPAVSPVEPGAPARPPAFFAADGQPQLLRPAAGFKPGFQRAKKLPAPDQLGVLRTAEALGAGEQPDPFQQIGLSLAVCPAQHS